MTAWIPSTPAWRKPGAEIIAHKIGVWTQPDSGRTQLSFMSYDGSRGGRWCDTREQAVALAEQWIADGRGQYMREVTS